MTTTKYFLNIKANTIKRVRRVRNFPSMVSHWDSNPVGDQKADWIPSCYSLRELKTPIFKRITRTEARALLKA